MAPNYNWGKQPILLALHWGNFEKNKTVLSVKKGLLEVFEEKNHHFWEESTFWVLILPFSAILEKPICCVL